MKRFLCIMLLVPGLKSLAQMDSIPKKALMDTFNNYANKVKIRADSANPEQRLSRQKQPSVYWLKQGTYSHNTARGQMYLMPYDSMPCLVPDSTNTKQMPILKKMPENNMPNAYKRKPPVNR